MTTGRSSAPSSTSPSSALPGARILEAGEHGLREARWEDLESVDHWRRFLAGPERYLRHL